MTQKMIDGIKAFDKGLLKECGGMAATIVHTAYCILLQ